MGRGCATCAHPERGAIDAALLAGERYSDLAETYGIGPAALSRHRNAHVVDDALEQAVAALCVNL